MRCSIPSEWTKDDFIYATWLAFIEGDNDDYDIIRDLQDCVQFGFTRARSNSFRVNYKKYANAIAEREK